MRILHKSKKALPPLPQVTELINKLLDTPNDDLHEVLSQIDAWKWPRSDLNAWIKVLNKFDAILEEVIRDYDIDNLQVNVLTPLTKKTVCEILRFERLLLENSTNRKTFNSYDRMNSLMATSDLDVLIYALNLLLRPAQQYSAQPAVSHALSISTPRLTALARRWSNLRDYDINLVDLVSDKGKPLVDGLPTEAREVHFTFYRKESSIKHGPKESDADVFASTVHSPNRKPVAPAASSSGSVTIRIDSQTLESKTTMDILADTIDAYSVPQEEKFELLTRIRTAQAFTKPHQADCEKLVIIRLLATAIFGHTHSESQAQSSIMLYEPEMISHIAELLQLDRGADVQVQSAAIAALDSLARYKGKIQDVLAAVNAGVNHGILMALLRKTVADVASAESTLPQSFVEALLSFVTFIAMHASGGNLVVGAGLVPLLIQIIENRLPNRLFVVSKSMQLVDNVLYGFNNAFQLFCAGKGVEVLVDRIEYEVDLDLIEFGIEQPSDVILSYGKLPVARAAVLKHTLRSMHRMMQSSGTAEGLRGLLDSSLLKSVKKIMDNRTIFGPTVLPIAINIMSTFVHNEPTCLTVIQEARLPETFYNLVEVGLEPVIEVIQAVPNAIGALCLNQAGQDQLATHPSIIPGLFAIFTSERHQRVLQDKENAVLFGTAIEELIRHHPSLKDPVFGAVTTTMDKIEELGKAFDVPENLKHWYRLQSDTPFSSSEPSEERSHSDMVMEQVLAELGTNAQYDAPYPHEWLSGRDENAPRSHDNIVISYVDVFCKFLEGLFQHGPHCKDFISSADGPQRLGRLTALPCLPYDFANSIASDSLVQVIRVMTESAPAETLAFLCTLVAESLAETKDFWGSVEDPPKLAALVSISGGEEVDANERFRKLITLYIRISLLTDIYSTAGYQHSRGTVTLLQTLSKGSAPNILQDLGALHRACVWENIELKYQGPDASSNDVQPLVPVPQSDPEPASGSQTEALSSTPSAANGALSGLSVDVTQTPTPKAGPPKVENKRDMNAKALKHIASQIPSTLTPFLQAYIRLFQLKRSSDPSQKTKILEAASIVADVVLKHLGQQHFESTLSLFAYYTVMLGCVNILLVDERGNQKTVQTVLLSSLHRIGGMDAIFDLCNSFITTIDAITQLKVDERTSVAQQELVHAFGGLKVALHLLHSLLSAKPVLESLQTSLIVTIDKKDTDPDYFEPHNFLVRLRLAAMPFLRRVWEAPWLLSAPFSVSRSVAQTVFEVINAEGEEVPPDASGGPSLVLGASSLPRAAPDENRIRQLTDMGFPRSAAERALARARNNVNAATELLLSHPFPLPADPEPEAVPEQERREEEHEADAEGVVETAENVPESDTTDAAQSNAPAQGTTIEPSVPGKKAEDWMKELNAAREPLKSGLGRQALRLVDEHPSLVFDIQRLFVGASNGYREQSVRDLIDDIKTFVPSAYGVHEQPMAVRCRLLALVLSEPSSPIVDMPESDARNLMDILVSLLLTNPVNVEAGYPTIPKWLATHLLVVEALLLLGEEPRHIQLPEEGEPITHQELIRGPSYSEARSVLFDFCIRLIAVPNLPRDELLSSLRLFVLFTHDHKVAAEFLRRDGVTLLLGYLKLSAGTPSAAGMQSYIATIMRHIVEDSSMLHHIMRQEVKRFFAHPRNRLVDVGGYVRSCGAMALRDPSTFISVTGELCQLSQPFSPMKTLSLKSETKANARTAPGTTNADNIQDSMQVDESPSVPMVGSTESLETLVHFLVGELMKTVKTEHSFETIGSDSLQPSLTSSSQEQDISLSSQPPNAEGTSSSSDHHADHTYSCFLMQCLSELLFSYESCKVAFLSYSPKKRTQTPAKEPGTKHRTAALQFLLSELVTFGTLNPQPQPESRKRIMLCNWSMSVIVALCVDTSPAQDIKDVPPELVSVRKFVIEAISRAIKDLSSSEIVESRYSRLLALADLCYRLLAVRFNMNPRKATEDSPTHISKIMLEKNLVATLTNALAEVDLNYPNIRGVVTAILRPLEYLSKIAIKMSRVSDKTKETLEEKAESVVSGDSDDDDAEEPVRENTPDLYRNSSLGMYGGEMADDHYGPDDEMDDDEEDDEDDVEMDFGDETGSEDTSNTDEDEDDVEDNLEHHTDASEERWQDEDDEDDEDLVEHDEQHGDDDDEDGDEDDEDEDEGDEVMWQDVPVDETTGNGRDIDDEDDMAGDPLSIVPADNIAEQDLLSDADEFEDEMGVLNMPDDGPVDVFDFGRGFSAFTNDIAQANLRPGHQVLWTGTVRSGRRRGGVDEDMDIFGRPRNPQPTAPDATTHPLLLDPAARSSSVQPRISRRIQRGVLGAGHSEDLLHTIEDFLGPGTVQFFQQIISAQTGGPGTEEIRVDVPQGTPFIQRFTRGPISASIRLERAPRPGDSRSDSRQFDALVTLQRWGEEAKMLHGRFEQSRLSKLNSHIVVALLPAAIEAAKQAKIAEEKETTQRQEAIAKAEQEAVEREKEEAENEKSKQAQQTDGTNHKGEGEAQEVPAEGSLSVATDGDGDVEMADATGEPPSDESHSQPLYEPTADSEAVHTEINPPVTEPGSSSVPERVTVLIHGSPVDITDTGIDPTFLEALPDDMREEVLNQHVRDQRAARIERLPDSQISPEFLDALPPEIRAEIIQQENIERARARAEEAPSQPGNAAIPADIDPASFIASLDPQLRQAVLLDQDDVFIQSLPSHMVAEAGLYRETHRGARGHLATHAAAVRSGLPQPLQPLRLSVSRDAIQLLDKSAITVLLRLLFFPQVLKKNLLFKILVNLCENGKTRTDLFNLLLSILQDGSGDLASIDRSFAQMSFRSSKVSTQQTPKAVGKQRMPSDYFGALSLPQSPNDIIPELIAQRCLEALNYIVSSNELSSLFFLTEHELPIGLRRSASKKGKGKEKQMPQTHYPVVLLLSLLDRQLLLKTPSIVESVVSLLATVTRPLASLKDIKKVEAEAPSEPTPVPPVPSETAAVQIDTASAPPSESPPKPQAGPATNVEEKILLANPPAIPQPVLRLIVNILTAGECSARTFAQSLSLIQHLSYIPDARDVIVNELRTRAQEFGHVLFGSLDELATALQESVGDVLASSVASKFSPASSDQAKFLRVLKTIDYMYSPKSTIITTSTPNDADVETVQSIYEGFRFTPLWQRLGDCLAIIEQKPELEHIATVLLPLIESLMVVCKYVGSKPIVGTAVRALRASASPRSPTTSQETMEELFVTFTDAHRKILNLMVRNNPSLMSGSFSLLVHNPRVLDFDNKRNFFNQQVHRRPATREHYGTLQLNVRRQRVFEDSFQYLQRKTGEQIKYGKLSIRFYEEEGVDAGGVTREWFQILARQMFDPNYALFQPCAADKLTYQPNRASWVNPEHLSFFKFVGRVIGKAIYDGRLLDAYFARSLYRQLLAKPVDYRDVEWVDPEYYNSLCWILENDPSALDLTFSVEADEFGVTKIVELKENGSSIPVTQENKREFVQLSAQYRLYSSIKDQIESLLSGFYEIIPKDLVAIFNEQELELLISGTPDIDVDEWRSATEYNGYTSSDPVVVWWWRALKSFNREERAKVLSFATGTSRVPLGGFVELQGVQGVQRFSIHRAYGDTDRLPQAHTCFNQIDLPQYSSYEMLRQQLLLAINEGGEGFGFA